ncbi:hypothetical protein ACQ4M3_25730 [Leptolyngbya sp. AN03gr2]|uniref:hypothetical protein n=1 Tax=unclassified Leptolyngbya TaxID=2650499 RepID=UPI003D322CA7
MHNALLTLIQQQFGLEIHTTALPLVEPQPLSLPDSRWEMVAWGASLVNPHSNERTRSEFLVAQLMISLALELNTMLFSGYPFEVQPELGLVGECDYLMTRSPRMSGIDSPIALIVEVKRQIEHCLPHCLVELVAAQQFNRSDAVIYGVLTTGLQWKFLKLEGKIVTIEETVYDLEPYRETAARIAGLITAERSTPT